MSDAVLLQLLALLGVVVLGYGAGRLRWLGAVDQDPARVISQAALYIFIPALLFRTLARMSYGDLPWRPLAAFFVPALLLLLGLWAWQRRRHGHHPAEPGIQALTAGFGNTVQIGIPLAMALFGEAGLSLHLTLVSVHALVLLTAITGLTELDVARQKRLLQGGPGTSALRLLGLTAVRTVVHPVVLPIVAGMAYHFSGAPLPALADEVLRLLGQAAVPLCLLMVGLSLAYDRTQGGWATALWLSALKLLLLPAAVLAVGHWGLGLRGLPLQVMVMAAALPTGSNALLFAQRYRVIEGPTAAASVATTLLFGLTAPLWLWVLQHAA